MKIFDIDSNILNAFFFFFNSTIIFASNLLIALLANDKLTSDNFYKWKSNMNIMLICENYKLILTEKYPQKSVANDACKVEGYDSWIQAS